MKKLLCTTETCILTDGVNFRYSQHVHTFTHKTSECLS